MRRQFPGPGTGGEEGMTRAIAAQLATVHHGRRPHQPRCTCGNSPGDPLLSPHHPCGELAKEDRDRLSYILNNPRPLIPVQIATSTPKMTIELPALPYPIVSTPPPRRIG